MKVASKGERAGVGTLFGGVGIGGGDGDGRFVVDNRQRGAARSANEVAADRREVQDEPSRSLRRRVVDRCDRHGG